MEALCMLFGFNSNVTWFNHCNIVAAKASKVLFVLCIGLCLGFNAVYKNVAYKSIVRPSMEYACAVWNLHTEKDCTLLDAVQHRAARWILKS